MPSKTEIANRALAKIGDSRVSNIETDSTERAEVINEMWDQVRDALLQSYPWNFALKLTNIAADGTDPDWGYDKRYLLPSDFLHLLSIKDDPDYKIIGNYIHTDTAAPLYIKYVKRVTDTGEFEPLFAEALAAHLAVEICEALTQSNTKKQLLLQERERVIANAYAVDAIQDPPQELSDDEWLKARGNFLDDIDYNI